LPLRPWWGKKLPEATKVSGKHEFSLQQEEVKADGSIAFLASQPAVNHEGGCRDFLLRRNTMDNQITDNPKSSLNGNLSDPGFGRFASNGAASIRPPKPPLLSDRYSSRAPTQDVTYSRPIFSTDLLAFKRDKASSTISFVLHAVVITLVLAVPMAVHTGAQLPLQATVVPLDFKPYIPHIVLPVSKPMSGGGGGGAHEEVVASKGHQPLVSKLLILHPQIIRIDHAKLEIEPTEIARIPETNKLPNFGMAQSPQILLASQGNGGGSGLGKGLGGGMGVGHGSGAGQGSGGAYGGSLMSVGGGVSAPVILHSVEPEFTDDARRANYQGSVSIKIIVDSQGDPQDVRLVSHLGMGLDEKAIEAVRQYRFKPAMYQGQPVSVQIVIDVDFHLH
jgi:TonB family protein